MPPPPAKRHPRLQARLQACIVSLRVADSNPSEGGNATIVLVSHHCQDELHSTEQPAQTVPPGYTAMEPRTICKDLWILWMQSISLLFYPIRCVFFCPDKHRASSGILNFALLSPPSPGYWKGVVVLCSPPCSLPVLLVTVNLDLQKPCISLNYFLIRYIGLAFRLVRKAPLCFPLSELVAPNPRPLFCYCFFTSGSIWWEQPSLGLQRFAFWAQFQDDHALSSSLSNSDNTLEICVLVNILRPVLGVSGVPGGWSPEVFPEKDWLFPGWLLC